MRHFIIIYLIDRREIVRQKQNIKKVAADIPNCLKTIIENTVLFVTPPGCMHALDIDALKKPEITFWSAWKKSELMCCAALKELDPRHAELKSMRTASTHLGKAIASYLLEFILAEASK